MVQQIKQDFFHQLQAELNEYQQLLVYTAQCPEMILNKIEQDLHKIKVFSS